MLILSRKVDQRVRIGSDVEIVVLAIEGDHVRLGIVAPRDVTILRNELLAAVEAENQEAAAAARLAAKLAPVLRTFVGTGPALAAASAGPRMPSGSHPPEAAARRGPPPAEGRSSA